MSTRKVYPELGSATVIYSEDTTPAGWTFQSQSSKITSQQQREIKQTPKANQIKALAYKAWSYQKKQMFTNICCISLCPLFMVLIAAGLGVVINNLIQSTTTVETILYCGNNNSLYPTAGFPIINRSDPRIYGYSVKDGKSVNFMRIVDRSGLRNPGAASLSANQPCSYWFDVNFPKNSDIYEANADLFGFAKSDSTYLSPPYSGWLGTLTNASVGTEDITSLAKLFQSYQQSSWVIYSGSTALSSVLGVNAKSTALSYTELISATSKTNITYTPYIYNASASTTGNYGLLGTMSGRYYANLTSYTLPNGTQATKIYGFQKVPYFVPVEAPTDDDLDSALSYYLKNLIANLATLDKSILFQTNPSSDKVLTFYQNAAEYTSQMPYGALFFNGYDVTKLFASFILHFGTDTRVSSSANFPSQGKRLTTQVALLGQSLLRTFMPEKYGNATITQGVRAFPEQQTTSVVFPFGGIIGRVLFPFGVSFLLPIFVIVLVKEKEDRIFVMMKLNGLKQWAYYASHYVTFFILYTISSSIFLIAGRISGLTFFSLTQPGVLILLFFIWGNVQISLSFLFAAIFNKSRIALVLVFLIVLCGVIISLVTDSLFSNQQAPAAFFIWPPFAFYRCLSVVNLASYNTLDVPYTISRIVPGDEVFTAVMFLIFEVFGYGLLAMYLFAILPSDFGVRRPWHFPITEPLKNYRDKKARLRNDGTNPFSESQIALRITINPEELKYEDDDVRAERAAVDEGRYQPNVCPIVTSHMRKIFTGRSGLGPKLAVKDVSFGAERGIVMGLLGPNGAGKTTLISILTGLYEASSGEAWLGGYRIKEDHDEICKIMGICPQFDILWDDLTIEEHLYFYARMKGINGKAYEDAAVDKSLAHVSLTTLRKRPSKRLSGGEKRRLSIAIALLGDPQVVFLDEPTTGLDPEVRRLIWNIIQDAKEGRTIVLTTHSMEEAEALCQRIGIMAKGTLRCIANPLRLKELYGTGFRLFFNSLVENTPAACAWIESILPKGWTKIDSFATNTSYEFPPTAGAVSRLFEIIEAEKYKHGILDWGISQTTLEEVFLRIITDDDANAD